MMAAMKPLIGISCCTKAFGLYGMVNHAASDTYVRAVDGVVGGVPVLVPANGDAADVPTLVARLDGLILTGSRSNVQPSLYGGPAHPADVPEDAKRDAVTLRLIRAAIAAGVPVLADLPGLAGVERGAWAAACTSACRTCRGGWTTRRRCIRMREGASGQGAFGVVGHAGRLAAPGCGGWRIIAVNSLHNQGIDALAPGLVRGGRWRRTARWRPCALPGARALTVGVQWHPEYDFASDAVSWGIFAAFGAAVRGQAALDPACQTRMAAD